MKQNIFGDDAGRRRDISQGTGSADEAVRRGKSYLQAVARIEKRFQSRSLYRQRLVAMAEGGSARPLGTVSSGNLTGREDIMARLSDLDQDLKRDLVHLEAIREQTWDLLSQLSHPKAHQLLEEFYLNGTSIQGIAAKTGYSERYLYRVKNRALQELGKLLREYEIEDPRAVSFG